MQYNFCELKITFKAWESLDLLPRDRSQSIHRRIEGWERSRKEAGDEESGHARVIHKLLQDEERNDSVAFRHNPGLQHI